MILSDEEIKAILGVNAAFCPHMEDARAIESAVLAKLNSAEPVTFYVCEGCGHYYMERVTSCDCMCNLDINEVQMYEHPPAPSVPAKQHYDNAMQEADEELDPIERLRFFLSLALTGQDWFDVEPFIDDLMRRAERDEYISRLTAALGLLGAETQIEAEINLGLINAERDKLRAAIESALAYILDSSNMKMADYFELRDQIDEALKESK